MAQGEINELLGELDGWRAQHAHHLTKTYKTMDFAQALALVNRIGALAEEQGHHPDITLSWGRVQVEIWTHKIDGLTESDFILAAKIDEMVEDVSLSRSERMSID
jgi:4a-hydroxytetrahydrobiopterin dehydratase